MRITAVALPVSDVIDFIDLDEYDDEAQNTITAETRKNSVSRRNSKRKCIRSTSDEGSFDGFMENGAPDRASAELDEMSVNGIGVRAVEWIDSLEVMRKKCKSLNGKISGDMKIYFERLKHAVSLLAARSGASGDPVYLIKKVNDLNILLAEEKSKYVNLSIQNELLEREYADYHKDVILKSLYSKNLYSKNLSGNSYNTYNRDILNESGHNSNETFEQNLGNKNKSKNRNKNKRKIRSMNSTNLSECKFKKGRVDPLKESKVTRYNRNRSDSKHIYNDRYINVDSEDMGREEDWAIVSRHRNKIKGRDKRDNQHTKHANDRINELNRNVADSNMNKAVVAIKCREGISYADTLKKARDEISLKRHLDIDDHHIKQAYTGGFLISVANRTIIIVRVR